MSKFEVKAISVVNLPGELTDRTVRRKGVAVVEPHREILTMKPGSVFVVDKTRKNELLALGAIDPKSIREIDDEKVPATEVPATETATTEVPATETATTEAPKPVKRKCSRSKEAVKAQSEAEVEHETDGSEMI